MPADPIERLRYRLAKHGRLRENGCIEFVRNDGTMRRRKKGYYPTGSFKGKFYPWHRLVCFLYHDSEILDDRTKVSCHKCDNTYCVNPVHLFVGTPSDNMKDCVAKGRHNPKRVPSIYDKALGRK